MSGVDDCDIRSMCWGIDPDTGVGYCIPFCVGSPDNPSCEDPNDRCRLFSDGVLINCYPTCDPLDPLDPQCPAGNVCAPSRDGEAFTCWPDASGDRGAYGEPCAYINVCEPGLLCASAEHVPGCPDVGCCTEYCDTDSPWGDEQCGEGQQCLTWWDETVTPPPDLANVGFCGIAPP